MRPRQVPRTNPRSALSGLCALLLWILATGLPTPLEAQLRITPQVGAYLPVTDMGAFRASGSDAQRELGRRNSSFAYGASLELSPLASPMGVRASLLYASDSSVPLRNVGCPERCPRSTLLTGSLDAVARARFPVVQPQVSAGVALKRYGFTFDEGFPTVLEDQDRWGVRLGVGATVSVMGLGITMELSDFIGGLEGADGASGNRQHDLFLTLGLALGR